MKTSLITLTLSGLIALALSSCAPEQTQAANTSDSDVNRIFDESNIPETAQVVTLGGGCFWCVEEVFHQVDGVYAAISGYMGGTKADAKYKKVAGGGTDHAEVVQVHFDPETIDFDGILKVFFKAHDPTQLNRQGPDYGRQYRSVIFYHSDAQKEAANAYIQKLEASDEYDSGDIVTLVEPAMEFYEAEDYHQNYARLNPGNPYLHQQLHPKLRKLGMEIPTGVTNREIKGSSSKAK